MKRGAKTVFIVDGYNVIHRDPTLRRLLDRSLEAARDGLLRYCAEWTARRRDVWRFYVVFDGTSTEAPGNSTGHAPGVTVLYSTGHEKADDRIVALVDQLADAARVTVVTDDNAVVRASRSAVVSTMTVARFRETLQPAAGRDTTGNPAAKTSLTTQQEQAITAELRRAWGLE